MALTHTTASSTPTNVPRGTRLTMRFTAGAISTGITMTVTDPEGVVHTYKGTTDGAGAYNFDTSGTLSLDKIGLYTISTTDGTTTLVYSVRTWAG